MVEERKKEGKRGEGRGEREGERRERRREGKYFSFPATAETVTLI
jgi:hypothetical protein